MIHKFRYQGLQRLFDDDHPQGVNPEHVAKLKNILATLDAAPTINHMNMPSYRLHPLKGAYKELWAVTVRANWRVIFRFDHGAMELFWHYRCLSRLSSDVRIRMMKNTH